MTNPERIVVSLSLDVLHALRTMKGLMPSWKTALDAAASNETSEYCQVRLDVVDAGFLASELTHRIVHTRLSRRTTELFDEAAEALEAALGRTNR